jgi:hypothetical protein
MRGMERTSVAIALLILFADGAAPAADSPAVGAGNAEAARLAASSALVTSARAYIAREVSRIGDRAIATNVRALVDDPKACVQHRAGETQARKHDRIEALVTAGLLMPSDGESLPGGIAAGLFPPVLDAGSACPHLPQPFFAAPGSSFGGHHSYPGGLVLHASVNELVDVGLSATYRRVYGHVGSNGLPIFADAAGGRADGIVDEDVAIAAPLLHDWAKVLVFQWNADGTELAELTFGGNGSTDNYGAPGNSRTAAHHIIGLAESMARGLPAKVVVTQATAHSSATSNNEYKIVNWLRAAAILAGIDPVARGYLRRDAAGHARLPAPSRLGDFGALTPPQVNAPVEYQLHNLSDGDFTQTVPSMEIAQHLLAKLAPDFGYDSADVAKYNTKYRNPALAHLSAERLYILYTNGGLDAVRAQLEKLHAKGGI